MAKGKEHLSCEESCDCSAWKRGGSGGILSMSRNTWWEAAKRTEPGPLQWCSAPGQEARDTKWNKRFQLNFRKHFFTVWVTKHRSRLPSKATREVPSSLNRSVILCEDRPCLIQTLSIKTVYVCAYTGTSICTLMSCACDPCYIQNVLCLWPLLALRRRKSFHLFLDFCQLKCSGYKII